MRCSACGHDNAADARFCEECGADLARLCPGCGTQNAPSAKFCKQCRAPLAAESVASAEGPAPKMPPPLPAAFAGGRYAVRRFLGEGAKKRVYLAHDTRLDRDVAFALIKTDGLDADGLVRVRREAQAMGRLGDHAHIVTIFDTGDEQGAPYIVGQFRAGGSVEELLAKADGHRVAADEAMRIAEQVCQALQHAHARGIVHRDLKPGNVWLDEHGDAALGDFGLAVVLDRSRMTMAGMMVGTVAYMAPEQALGRSPDARSDLYALGAMLYEMLCGRPPFLGDDAVGVISQHINTPPVAPTWHESSVPKPLEALVLRLLAKSPEERPASAADVGQELRRILDRSTVDTVQPPAPDAATDLRALNWGWFVGRREEMDALKDALEGALSGKGALAMLVGEPGIGKTRLAEEFAVYAGLRGAQLLTGHCYEGEASLPYRPFIEALRQYTRGRPDAELRGEMGAGAPEIATLVSEIRRRFPDVEEAPKLDPEAERLRLFESVTEFLHNASLAQPLVLHLDDLHWSDKPSLLLLQHLAQRTARDRLLILGAYRDVELDRTHPLSETLGALRRLPNYRRVLLRGLPQETVQELLAVIDPSEEGAAGRQALAAALHQETEGNPFFIREVLAHLIETGKIVHEGGRWVGKVTSVSELGIPEGVREVIGRRLSQLSPACNRMLTLASTLTGGFAWEVLKAINADVSEPDLLDLLEEALSKQLIAERKGELSDTYDFTHALIRQTLYGELSGPRRVLLHRQIGEALERLYENSADAHLPELAHHFYQAAPGGDVQKAIDYARRAGDRAVAVAAWEEAVANYERALQAFELAGPLAGPAACDVLLALAQARLWTDTSSEESREAYRRAASLAREAGDGERLALAAIGIAKVLSVGLINAEYVRVLQDALDRLPPGADALRARVLARLGQEMYFGEQAAFEQLTTEAVALARASGDQAALAEALSTRAFGGGIRSDAETTLTASAEIIDAADASGDPTRAMLGIFQRFVAAVVLGRIDLAHATLDLYDRRATQLRIPFYFWQRELIRGMFALTEGRLEDAERLAQSALVLGQRGQPDTALQMFSAQLFAIRREQRRLAELEAGIVAMVQAYPAIPAWRTALAFNYIERGMRDDAHREFEVLAKAGFAPTPEDGNWPLARALLTAVASSLGEAARAAELYEQLLPAGGRIVMVGAAVDSYGSVDRLLGMLASTLGQWSDAEQHFAAAIDMHRRIGFMRWLAWTQFQHAEMLVRRDAAGDHARAVALATEAIDIAEPLGMTALVERGLALKLQAQGALTSGVYPSIDAVTRAVDRERPDLSLHAASDGALVIMFSDIEEHTPLVERLGDERWMVLLREHNAIVREQLAAHGGHEVKSEGDGFMVVFSDPRRALRCAIAIQSALATRNTTAEEPLRVRIGLHAGNCVREDGDFYGRNVILASRIAGQAKGGEIMVSSPLRDLVGASLEPSAFESSRDVELKGLSGVHTVYAVAV
jgi:class 3 adenylate cyclase